jgi:hypothetical protein
LIQAKLPDAEAQESHKREHIDDCQEKHLCPHQPLLSFVTPSDKNAIVARRSEFPGAENEELVVDQSKAHPNHRNTERPKDEEHLEVKVQTHAWSANVLAGVASVGGERPQFSRLALFSLLVDSGAETPVVSLLQFFIIDILPAAQVHSPHDDNCEEDHKD